MIKFDSEKSFEQFLVEQFKEKNNFIVRDEYYDKCHRQFDTKGYGICDLVFVRTSPIDDSLENFEIDIHVSELKNEQIKPADIAQLCRYKEFFTKATMGMKNVTVTYSLVVPWCSNISEDVGFLIGGLDDSIEVWDFYLRPESGVEFDPVAGWVRADIEDVSALNNIIQEGTVNER